MFSLRLFGAAWHGQGLEKSKIFRVRFARQMSKESSVRASSEAVSLLTELCPLRTLYHNYGVKE